MHCDAAEHLVGYFAVDLQIFRLHVFLFADLTHDFLYYEPH